MTVFTCRGDLSLSEIEVVMKRFYEGIVAPPTKKVLCDLRKASIGSLSSDQLNHIVNLSLENEGVMKGGKTAVVAPDDIDFGLARSFEMQAAGEQRDLMVFRTYEEAMDWIEE